MTDPDANQERLGRYRRRLVGERRTHRTVIKHTDAEWARVAALAAAQGISVPRLYERGVSTGDVAAAAEVSRLVVEVHAIQRVLAGAARNLNQIARAANAGGDVSQSQVLAAADAMQRQVDRICDVVARIPGGDYLNAE